MLSEIPHEMDLSASARPSRPSAVHFRPPGLHGFPPLRGKTPPQFVRVSPRRSGAHGEPVFISAMAIPSSTLPQLWHSPPKAAAQHLKLHASPFKAVGGIPHRRFAPRRTCPSPRSSDDTESCATSQGDPGASPDAFLGTPNLPHAARSEDDLSFLLAGIEGEEAPL